MTIASYLAWIITAAALLLAIRYRWQRNIARENAGRVWFQMIDKMNRERREQRQMGQGWPDPSVSGFFKLSSDPEPDEFFAHADHQPTQPTRPVLYVPEPASGSAATSEGDASA